MSARPRRRDCRMTSAHRPAPRLAGFARTLRDNGFKVGLAETSDALAILASPAAARPSSLEAGVARAVLRDPFGLGAIRRDLRRLLAGPRHAPRQTSDRRRRAASRASRRLASAQAPRQAPRPTRSRASGGGDEGDSRRTRPARRRLARRDLVGDRPAPHRRSRRCRRDPRARGAARADDARRGSCAASRCAGADGGSTCAAPFIATSRTAARRSTSPGAGARSSRCGSSCCSMPRAR